MLRKLTSLLLLCLPLAVFAQENITVCHTPALEKFGLFASNKSFNTDHPAPRDYVHSSVQGRMIKFDTPDGQQANAFFLKADAPSSKYLIVIHEWWGLNDYVKREAETLFDDLGDVNVIAVDMYDGKVASNPEDAGKLMGAMDAERGKNIIEGVFNLAGDGASFATIGWCFGGGWSLESSLLAGDAASACVIYYGMPVTDVDRLRKLEAPVLGIFGSRDQWITPAVVSNFEDSMEKAGKTVTIEMYDANHAFANPSNPEFDQEATADAYAKALTFLKKEL